jgi:hypothetical protein
MGAPCNFSNQTSCIACEVADSTIMRKWKWQFVIGYIYKYPIFTAGRILTSCQNRINASIVSGIILPSNDT